MSRADAASHSAPAEDAFTRHTDGRGIRTPARPTVSARRGLSTRRTHRRDGRIVGLDLARFVALAGMMAAHVWNEQLPGGGPTVILTLVQGRAAALFAVLAGIGIVLSTRRYLTGEAGAGIRQGAGTGYGAATRAVLMRGLVIAMIGLTLGLLDSGVAIILVFYGVTFWLAVPFLRVRTGALFGVALAWAVVWPVASFAIRAAWQPPTDFENPSWESLTHPMFIPDLLMTGVYPVLTWIVYVLVGMGVGRLILRAADAARGGNPQQLRALAVRMFVIGAGVAVAGWGLSALAMGPLGGIDAIAGADAIARADGSGEDAFARAQVVDALAASGRGIVPLDSPWWLLSSLAHSGSTLDLALTTGTALVAIGACLFVGMFVRGAAAIALAPVAAAGGAPLTVYCAHIVAKTVTEAAVTTDGSMNDDSLWLHSSPQVWLLHVAGALVIGAILALLGRSGPLETAVRWFSRQAALPLRAGTGY